MLRISSVFIYKVNISSSCITRPFCEYHHDVLIIEMCVNVSATPCKCLSGPTQYKCLSGPAPLAPFESLL